MALFSNWKPSFLIISVLIIGSNWLEVSCLPKRALQPSHQKPQSEIWMDKFYGRNYKMEKTFSLVNLILMIAKNYLSSCIPIVLYERTILVENMVLFQHMFKKFPNTYIHGEVINETLVNKRILDLVPKYCQNYILILNDIVNSPKILHKQHTSRVVIISWSSQWRVQEFLSNTASHSFTNLLVVGESVLNQFRSEDTFILYTHRLYTDGLGASLPQVLTSWKYDHLTRSNINLFPRKLSRGLAGHRFLIGVANQPPYVVKQRLSDSDGSNERIMWDGIEIRLLQLMANILNFTVEFKEYTNLTLGSGAAITNIVKTNKVDIGVAGIYITNDRLGVVDMTFGHSEDCAAFISLTSTALPKYRAIMGPFKWTVWLALTFTYFFAILPLSFSDKHSFRYLIDHPGSIENMFWYVFGTFTNCFTFKGEQSWSRSSKITTRLLIGIYWCFTIIITACYTGSIIAFVTLPIFPETLDTTDQFLDEGYRLVVLNKDGWNYMFRNSSDSRVIKLFKNVKYVSDVHEGLRNVTHSFFWKYTFLGSRDLLDYVIRTNFSTAFGKRALLHVSKECFVPYSVSLIFPLDSSYKGIINEALLRARQSGFMSKITDDIKWNLYRSSTGKLLQASASSTLKLSPPEDKALTLDDTQGMFLLLGAGFFIALCSLISEYVGGCVNYCKRKQFLTRRRSSFVPSTSKSCHVPTPRGENSTSNIDCMGGSFTSMEKQDHRTDSQTILIHTPKHGLKNVNGDGDDISIGNCSLSTNITDIDEMFDLDYLFGEEFACNESLKDKVIEENGEKVDSVKSNEKID